MNFSHYTAEKNSELISCARFLFTVDWIRIIFYIVWSVFFFPLSGLFAAAHDMNIEWVIVKGISHFSDDSNTPDESWKSFASIMAASLVSNMLNDPVVFKQWPHYEGIYMSHPTLYYWLIINSDEFSQVCLFRLVEYYPWFKFFSLIHTQILR